jgi:hypothetical protein
MSQLNTQGRPSETASGPRVGTIVWGAILLVIAAASIVASNLGLGELTPARALWTVVGLGGVLIIAAIVAVVVRAARLARTASQTADTPDELDV